MAEPYEIRIKITGEGAPQVKMMKRDLEGVKRAAGVTDKKLAAANKQTKALAGNMRRASTQARGMGLNIKKALGYFGVAAGGYMVVGQLKSASGMAMQLEKDLANVNSLLGRAHPMYGQYREDIMKLKRIVPVLEINDLTAGLYEGISAGHDAGQVMTYLTATSKAAAGGWTDVATVIKGTNKVMAAYGIQTKDAMYVTDIGLKTVEKGNLSYADYADKIGMCVGTAATAKVAIEELHGAIAAASKIQKPEQVFTGLRGAMLDLPKKRKELKLLGIEYTTFGDTLRQIKEAEFTARDWEKLGLEREAAENVKAIILQYKTFRDTVEAVGAASGATIDKFNERMATTEGKTKAAISVVDEYKTAIGVELNEALVIAIAGMDAFNKSASEPIDMTGVKEFGAVIKGIAKGLNYINWARKQLGFETQAGYFKRHGIEMEEIKYGPLKVAPEVKFKPPPPSKTVMTPGGAMADVKGAPVGAARTITTPGGMRADIKAGPRGGDIHYNTTIHNLQVKSDKVDSAELMKTLGKIVDEENPAI